MVIFHSYVSLPEGYFFEGPTYETLKLHQLLSFHVWYLVYTLCTLDDGCNADSVLGTGPKKITLNFDHQTSNEFESHIPNCVLSFNQISPTKIGIRLAINGTTRWRSLGKPDHGPLPASPCHQKMVASIPKMKFGIGFTLNIWAAVKKSIVCWCLVRKYRLSFFWGSYCFTGFYSNQH